MFRWFNWGAPVWHPYRRKSGDLVYVKLWNLFRRCAADGDHWWGAGLLQIDTRHLAYVGHTGVCVGFVWVLGRHQ